MSVAARFLVDLPAVDATVKEAIAYHMAFAHQAVSDASLRHGSTAYWRQTIA